MPGSPTTRRTRLAQAATWCALNAGRRITVRDLAAEMGWAVSAAHRILRELADEGIVDYATMDRQGSTRSRYEVVARS